MISEPNRKTLGSVVRVPFWEAIGFWLKLGFISFGGPAGQIALMHQELVIIRRWISEKRFLHALNYCMVLPGPEAQQLATYIGWLMHGNAGGIIAGTLFVLPSLLILIALSWVYIAFGNTTWVEGIFYGIKPAVTAIVALATFRVGSRILTNPILWSIAILAFFALFLLHLQFPIVIFIAAIIGLVGGKIMPAVFLPQKASSDTAPPQDAPMKSDIMSAHSQFSWPKTFTILASGALLWVLPLGALTLIFDWQHTYTQMAWFFTKAALLTFGGAYAVLPYVYQGAINYYGWLSPTQMIDGLALGETTPGPLIMIVAFVGFVGAYTGAIFGGQNLFIAGALGAVLVTWFTFLPSFLFILVGGPLVESTHGNVKFTAPLTAITAAVVGGILNLALFFCYHLLWPRGFGHPIDGIAAAIALGAAISLFYYKRDIIHVIIACAVVGLIIQYL